MKSVLRAGLLLVGMAVGLSSFGVEGSGVNQGSSGDPYVIRAGNTARTAIGLIYSPELLASLLAKRPDEAGGGAIGDAVTQSTPVVVMWSMPVPPEVVSPPTPPWRISIFPSRNRYGLDKIEPLWLIHDGNLLARLDPRVRQGQVGAVAAFPRDALVAGRMICLYFDLPPDYEKKIARSVDRCAELN